MLLEVKPTAEVREINASEALGHGAEKRKKKIGNKLFLAGGVTFLAGMIPAIIGLADGVKSGVDHDLVNGGLIAATAGIGLQLVGIFIKNRENAKHKKA